MEAFAPERKDIVIVLDGTQNPDGQVDKEAVLTIIDTTNPNDRVSRTVMLNRTFK